MSYPSSTLDIANRKINPEHTVPKMNATQTTVSRNEPLVMQSALHRDSQARPFDSTSELVGALSRLARGTTHVEKAGNTMCAPVRIDVVVSSPSGRIGIICDQSDARKIHRRPSLLNELFVERVYVTSGLDAMMDPISVARTIARREPDLFRALPESHGGSLSKVRVAVVPGVRVDSKNRPSRRARQLQREWSDEVTRAGQAA